MGAKGSLAVLLAIVAIQAPGCGEEKPPPPSVDPDSRRTTRQGEVVGFTSGYGAHVWRGLPFAKPPVGELRWRAPVPPEPWQGKRDSLRFGAPCAQFGGPLTGVDTPEGKPAGSEDCLYLNVFAPRFTPDAVPAGLARRPVMVWIHGGGNTIGSAHAYDASFLAKQRDVVVVTVQYRLGVFGWFTHPSLRDGRSWRDDSGNYGTLDLIQALRWVEENVAAFGGDPGRITIFGESAGGANVFSLLLSPAAKGRFHRAITQSGRLRTVSVAEAERYEDDPVPGRPGSSSEVLVKLLEREGLAEGRAAAKIALSGMSGQEVAALLRGVPAPELLSLFDGDRLGGMYDSPRLVRDGRVLPLEDSQSAFGRRGGSNEVPVLLGTNRDENKIFLLFGSPHVRRLGGLPLGLKNERLFELNAEYLSLMWKAQGVDEPATAMRRVRDDVFAFRFDWDDERRLLWLDLRQLLGASHGLEIPFVFGTLRLAGAEKYVFDSKRQQDDRRLANAMTSYWTRFAATGDPGTGRDGDLPRWEPWATGPGSFVVLDSDHDAGIRMSDDTVTRDAVLERIAGDPRFESDAERCEIYQAFFTWSRSMTREEVDERCSP